MDMVVPRDKDQSLVLRDCAIRSCNISMNNDFQDVYAIGMPPRKVLVGSTIEVDLSIAAARMENINEPYEIASVREKRVRDCTLGELILAIAGKS